MEINFNLPCFTTPEAARLGTYLFSFFPSFQNELRPLAVHVADLMHGARPFLHESEIVTLGE